MQRKWKDWALAYALLAPSALVLAAFSLAPLWNAGRLSLQKYQAAPGPYVGLANYERALFHEPGFWQAVAITCFYVVGSVPTTLVLGYVLAELLHARIRGLAVYRTLFFVPYVASPVAAAAVWSLILNPNYGVANSLLAKFGVRAGWLQEPAGIFQLTASALHQKLPEWAAGPSLALCCITGVTVWHSVGFAVVVLLAGLAAVPSEVLEAARIDGARGWALIRTVKLPLLSPTLFFLLVVFTIRAFQTFTQIFVLSSDNLGGPNGTTRNITMYIYRAFRDQQFTLGFGYGSAVAILLFLLILALTLLQFRALGSKVHYQ